MNRREIEAQLQKNDSTLLSFPDRGPWGDKKWRGNCSGWIQAFLIWKYKVEKMAELFAGSGTGSDVARDMGINYIGGDLNPNPVRNNILSFDAISEDVPEEFVDADMLFMHPPYSSMIRIPYAGSMYPDKDNTLSRCDLGQMDWDKFMKTLNEIIMKYYVSMEKGSRMSILMGDVRRDGKCYSMLKDIVQPGQLDQIIIKAQHNCVSDGRTYAHKNFVPIVHEYIMVIKKLAPYLVDFSVPIKREMDIRDSKSATWCAVAYAIMVELGGDAHHYTELSAEVYGHKKAEDNHNVDAKMRQTLNRNDKLFEPLGNGYYRLRKSNIRTMAA